MKLIPLLLLLVLPLTSCQNFTPAHIQQLIDIANQVRQASGK